MLCMLDITMEQSSVHTSVFSGSAITTIATDAPASIFAEPTRHSDIFSSVSFFCTTISSHGRIFRPDGESRPASTMASSASLETASSLYCLILRLCFKRSKKLINATSCKQFICYSSSGYVKCQDFLNSVIRSITSFV